MTRPQRFVSTVLMGSLLVSLPAFGRDSSRWSVPEPDRSAADKYYGRGVHAYLAGQDHRAESYLSLAIESNPNDPRPYYFRAMSRLRQGRAGEARQDMQIGAFIEAGDPHRWAVGTALQRVQGPDRLMLEKYRRRARLDEAMRQEMRMRTRYEHAPGPNSKSPPTGDPFADDSL
jgi:tetratricopeptide (TPR) repeat protein